MGESIPKVKLIFFRHGQTDWNASGRIQGHLDIPLNDEGRNQAWRLIEPIARWQPDGFLSSDLSRAYVTAKIVAEEMGMTVSKDPGLREIFLGKIQGMTRAEITELFGEEYSTRLRHEPINDEDVVRLGSESNDQVLDRVGLAIDRHLKAHPEIETLAVCSHGGVIRRLIQSGLADGQFPPPTPNTVLYPFEWLGLGQDSRKFVKPILFSPWD